MIKKFYLTSAIPYVNAAPHIGHALEFVETDAIGRYHRLLGEEVTQLSGGDENALKNVQASEKAGVPVQQFADKNTQLFYELTKKLNTLYDIWQKGSDTVRHFPASQKLWELCGKNGDIYKKSYEGLYCVGCEQFYTEDELDQNGECFEHPGKKLEKVKEENYFFKLSKYQQQLIDLVSSDTLKIIPETRKNEVLSFLKLPLRDISISRTNERAKNWGVPVPGDPGQRIYVWFDALNIYQSGVGFGWDEKKYKKWWPADIHVIGKGITRFHAIYWPAFLLSAKLAIPKSIFVHGYFTVNGEKMSKSIGNVIDPLALIDKYGADPLRYYFLAKFSPFSDGDFSEEEFKKTYNADLANGLGNLVARVAKLAEGLTFKPNTKVLSFITEIHTDSGVKPTLYKQYFDAYKFDEVLRLLWGNIKVVDEYLKDYLGKDIPLTIRDTDQHINNQQPWTLKGQQRQEILQVAVDAIRYLATQLQPFLPDTADKILNQFKGPTIKSQPPLFPRLI